MIVLSSVVLDPVEHPPIGGKTLRTILETTGKPDDRSQLRQERALALAVATLWAGDRRRALDELAAADIQVTDDERLYFFAAYAMLVAADGFDRARAARAWQRLVSLAPRCNDRYCDLELESDYAFADPTAAMERAARIAARNR